MGFLAAKADPYREDDCSRDYDDEGDVHQNLESDRDPRKIGLCGDIAESNCAEDRDGEVHGTNVIERL